MASTKGNLNNNHRGRTTNNVRPDGVDSVIKLHPFIIHMFLRKVRGPMSPSNPHTPPPIRYFPPLHHSSTQPNNNSSTPVASNRRIGKHFHL